MTEKVNLALEASKLKASSDPIDNHFSELIEFANFASRNVKYAKKNVFVLINIVERIIKEQTNSGWLSYVQIRDEYSLSPGNIKIESFYSTTTTWYGMK